MTIYWLVDFVRLVVLVFAADLALSAFIHMIIVKPAKITVHEGHMNDDCSHFPTCADVGSMQTWYCMEMSFQGGVPNVCRETCDLKYTCLNQGLIPKGFNW